jgi:DNA-binding response OmpR family regulator
MPPARITALLIDDDVRLASLLKEYLGKGDIDLQHVEDGERGLAALRRAAVDVVLLDLMLPGLDGLEVCRRIRATPELANTAVLMLTAKGDDVDRIVGLELGADDYLPKPFNPRELLARIRAVLRRGAATGSSRPRFRSGGLEIDFDARSASLDGKPVVLTSYEYQLLVTLAKAAGRVLSREQLLDDLKGEEYESFDRSIDVHISKLRSKLEPNPREPRYIKTVRGVGYVLSRDGGAT